MTLLSSNLLLSPDKTLTLFNHPSFTFLKNPRFLLKPPSPKLPSISASLSSSTTTAPDLYLHEAKTSKNFKNWAEFASRISGEWDGFGADFTADGSPIELPDSVVPEAFREWEVQIFDWQTQCPTLASESGNPVLSYNLIKLLPTVGCEADAATRHSVDERIAGGLNNKVSAFGYDQNGCYVAVWPLEKKVLELEHCFVDPKNREVRVRVIQVVRMEEEGLWLEGIKVFSEQWYGPWRNGEQFGGCAIRESGFASTDKVEVSEVVGVWDGRSIGVARFENEEKDVLHELVGGRPQKLIRDQVGLVALPKNLWCSLKEKEDGETWGEVGWLIDCGLTMTSRCVFRKDGRLKEMAIGQETAVLKDM